MASFLIFLEFFDFLEPNFQTQIQNIYLDRYYCNLISSLSHNNIFKRTSLNFPKPNKKRCQIIVIMALCQAYDKKLLSKKNKRRFLILHFSNLNLLRHLLTRQKLLIKSLSFSRLAFKLDSFKHDEVLIAPIH